MRSVVSDPAAPALPLEVPVRAVDALLPMVPASPHHGSRSYSIPCGGFGCAQQLWLCRHEVPALPQVPAAPVVPAAPPPKIPGPVPLAASLPKVPGLVPEVPMSKVPAPAPEVPALVPTPEEPVPMIPTPEEPVPAADVLQAPVPLADAPEAPVPADEAPAPAPCCAHWFQSRWPTRHLLRFQFQPQWFPASG